MGFTSSRHAHLKFTVIEVLQRFLPKTAEVAQVEPSSSDYYPFKNGKNTDIRNDIAVTIDGVTTLCDTVVSHPNPVVHPLVATVAGTAAQLAFQQKQTMYNDTFVIPTGHVVPLSAETGGRLHADFKGFIKRCVARGLVDAGSSETEWTDATRVIFSSRMRSACAPWSTTGRRAGRRPRTRPPRRLRTTAPPSPTRTLRLPWTPPL
jgi:hypothetical protein